MQPISRSTQRWCWFGISTALRGLNGSGVSTRYLSFFFFFFVVCRRQKRIGVTPRSLAISNTIRIIDFIDRSMMVIIMWRSSRESSVLMTLDRWARMDSKRRLSVGDEFLKGTNTNQYIRLRVSYSAVHNQYGSSDDLTELFLFTIEQVEERIIESHAQRIDKS